MAEKIIQKQNTWLGEFDYMTATLAVGILVVPILLSDKLGSALPYIFGITLVLDCVWIIYAIVRHVRVQLALGARDKSIDNLAVAHQADWTFMPEVAMPSEFAHSSLSGLPDDGVADLSWRNYITSKEWSYVDAAYAVFQRTKTGRYVSGHVFYGVMAVPLPRILPNVLFDSVKDRGQQFERVFRSDQQHQLEGDFNNYFTAYFPTDYAIDSLSFITPDVMQAMIAASDYDIEIVGNVLLLYGPLFDPVLQIDDMQQKATEIQRTLQLTAQAYRDDRLPTAQAMQTVTPAGMFLRRRGWHLKLSAAISIGLYIIYFIYRISSHS